MKKRYGKTCTMTCMGFQADQLKKSHRIELCTSLPDKLQRADGVCCRVCLKGDALWRYEGTDCVSGGRSVGCEALRQRIISGSKADDFDRVSGLPKCVSMGVECLCRDALLKGGESRDISVGMEIKHDWGLRV